MRQFSKVLLHLLLFILTFATTTFAGMEWTYGKFVLFEPTISAEEWRGAMLFATLFLGILTVHEFGHYFAAAYYKIKATLPYYIPLWFGFIGAPSIGTAGAVIKIKDKIESKLQYFDVGIAGPLAGFVVALLVLIYGFLSLPPAEYIYEVHPGYMQYGQNYHKVAYQPGFIDQTQRTKLLLQPNNGISTEEQLQELLAANGSFSLGGSLMYDLLSKLAPEQELVPNMHEVIHYPWLFAGYLALFFTALNLLPIGQLDGGHILYGLIGVKRHSQVSLVLFTLFVTYAGLGLVSPFAPVEDLVWLIPLYVFFLMTLYSRANMQLKTRVMVVMGILAVQLLSQVVFPEVQGYTGWLLFAFLLGRVIGIFHPKAQVEEPLGRGRVLLGWLSLLIFLLCFSPTPFVFT